MNVVDLAAWKAIAEAAAEDAAQADRDAAEGVKRQMVGCNRCGFEHLTAFLPAGAKDIGRLELQCAACDVPCGTWVLEAK